MLTSEIRAVAEVDALCKRSGIGRENGQSAIDAYFQAKSIWINLAQEVPNLFVMH